MVQVYLWAIAYKAVEGSSLHKRIVYLDLQKKSLTKDLQCLCRWFFWAMDPIHEK